MTLSETITYALHHDGNTVVIPNLYPTFGKLDVTSIDSSFDSYLEYTLPVEITNCR